MIVRFPMTLMASLATLLLHLHPGDVAAQHLPPEATRRIAPAAMAELRAEPQRRSAPDASPRRPHLSATRASYPRVLAGTLAGGLVIGGVGALLGFALEPLAEMDDDYFEDVLPAFLGGVGHVIGAPIGARWAATADGVGPGLGRMLLVSLGAAAVGGLLWSGIGEGFEPDEAVVDYTSWYVGAAVGITTHLAATSVWAWRAGRRSP